MLLIGTQHSRANLNKLFHYTTESQEKQDTCRHFFLLTAPKLGPLGCQLKFIASLSDLSWPSLRLIAAILWLQQSCDCCSLSDQLSLHGRLRQYWSQLLYVKALLTVTSWKQSLGNSKHFKLLDRIEKSEICWDTIVKSAIIQIWCAPWTSRMLVNNLKEHSKRNLILDKASRKWISVRQKRQRTHSSLSVVK